MKPEELRITVYSYAAGDMLPDGVSDLVDRAKQATRNAWAPYSRFMVGAAVELENREIISGNNQENVAFPSGLCAERVALFYAGSQFPDVAVKRIAVAAFTNDAFVDEPVFPCGSCRQVLLELEHRSNSPVEVIMYGESSIKIVKSAADLLPLPFNYDLLK